MSKIDNKSYKNIDIYYIEYITINKIDDESIYSVNYYVYYSCKWIYWKIIIINKYLVFDSVDENQEIWKKKKKYANAWDGIKTKRKAIKGSKENDDAKDYIKTKFNSGDHLPLNKPLKFHVMTIIIRSVFEEDDKL